MNSGYFAQYLLNEGKITQTDIFELLKNAAENKADTPITALRKGMLSAEQIASIKGDASGEGFLREAGKNGLLSAVQMEELRSAVRDEDLAFAQVLLDRKLITFAELADLFKAYDALEVSPIRTVVKKRALETGLEMEADRYAAFSELFIHSLKRFMDTTVVVNTCEPIHESAELSHIVSQRLLGGVSMVTGVYAKDEVFLEMARRYSHEDIQSVDALAVDCICEFLNVVNGLFAVDAARDDMEIDLDMPRVSENSEPEGNFQLVLVVDTGFGEFALVLAGDEFALRS